jgi:hypothetical protein
MLRIAEFKLLFFPAQLGCVTSILLVFPRMVRLARK